jgi:hypothetical protein
MAGTLHIFKRNEDPLEFQANYNLGAASWVKVFDPVGLDHFLKGGSGLTANSIEALLADLSAHGHTSEAPVNIPESHLAEMGFAESPSDE